MPRMHRYAAILVAIGLAVPTSTAVAQAPSIGVGAAVPYADPAGAEAGQVTIKSIEDPYTGFREDSPPADGQRYVLVTVAFQAADDKPFEAHPSDILLQDTDGFLWANGDVRRPDGATPKDLESQDLAAGDRVSGVIGFVVPKGSVIDQVYYQPSGGGRLVTLVDQVPQVGPPVGTDVPYNDPTGTESGTVTVRTMEDPFTGFRDDSPPADGQRYILLTVAFQAADDKPFEAHPSDIVLQDTDGFLWANADVRRADGATPKELQSQDLAAGDRVSGVIGFAVPTSAVIAKVLYQPQSGGRLVTVVDASVGGPSASPVPSTVSGASPAPSGAADVLVDSLLQPADLPSDMQPQDVADPPAFDIDSAAFAANGGVRGISRTWQSATGPVLAVFDFRLRFPTTEDAIAYLAAAEPTLSEAAASGLSLVQDATPLLDGARHYSGEADANGQKVQFENYLFNVGPVVAKEFIAGVGMPAGAAQAIARTAADRMTGAAGAGAGSSTAP